MLRRMLRCKPGEDLPISVQSNDFRALCQLAGELDVVLLAPVRALANEIESGNLVQISVPEFGPLQTRFSIVHLAQRTLSPAAERAIETLSALAS